MSSQIHPNSDTSLNEEKEFIDQEDFVKLPKNTRIPGRDDVRYKSKDKSYMPFAEKECPYPNCMSCLWKLPEPEKITRFRKTFSELSDSEPFWIELWVSSLRKLLKIQSDQKNLDMKPGYSAPYFLECGIIQCMMKLTLSKQRYVGTFSVDILRFLIRTGRQRGEGFIEPQDKAAVLLCRNGILPLSSKLLSESLTSVRYSTCWMLCSLLSNSSIAFNKEIDDEGVTQSLVNLCHLSERKFIEEVRDREKEGLDQVRDIIKPEAKTRNEVLQYSSRYTQILHEMAYVALNTIFSLRSSLHSLIRYSLEKNELRVESKPLECISLLRSVLRLIDSPLPTVYPESKAIYIASEILSSITQHNPTFSLISQYLDPTTQSISLSSENNLSRELDDTSSISKKKIEEYKITEQTKTKIRQSIKNEFTKRHSLFTDYLKILQLITKIENYYTHLNNGIELLLERQDTTLLTMVENYEKLQRQYKEENEKKKQGKSGNDEENEGNQLVELKWWDAELKEMKDKEKLISDLVQNRHQTKLTLLKVFSDLTSFLPIATDVIKQRSENKSIRELLQQVFSKETNTEELSKYLTKEYQNFLLNEAFLVKPYWINSEENVPISERVRYIQKNIRIPYFAPSTVDSTLVSLNNLSKHFRTKDPNFNLSTELVKYMLERSRKAKEKGNLAFGQQQYQISFFWFSTAINLFPTQYIVELVKSENDRNLEPTEGKDEEYKQKNPISESSLNSELLIYYSNRAETSLKLGNCFEALIDCEESLKIDPSHLKSLNRKWRALSGLLKDE